MDIYGRITAATSNAYQYADTINYGILRVPSGSNLTVSSGDLSLTASNVISALGYTPATSGAGGGSQWTTSGTSIYYGSGNVGLGSATNPSFALELSGTTIAKKTIGINGKAVVFLPDQSLYTGSIYVGDGGRSVSYTTVFDGSYNTSVGIGTMASATTGYMNTTVGTMSAAKLTTGYNNTAIGVSTLANLTTGVGNLAVGNAASNALVSGTDTVAIGRAALYNNYASSNTAVGSYAAYSTTSATGVVAVGYQALYTSSGVSNTAVGFSALASSTTGYQLTAIGESALKNNTTGWANTAVGSSALFSNTIGTNNVALGSVSLKGNTTGSSNSGFGTSALLSNTTGSNNTAIGSTSLFMLTGSDNTTVGSFSMAWSTMGDKNTALGSSAIGGFTNSTGSSNVAVGYQSLYSLTSGTSNTSLGTGALYANSTGSSNIAIGSNAGSSISTGNYNVIIGSNTGSTIAASSNNILVADGQGNERFRINSSGNMGLGVTSPSYKLDVSGDVNVTGNFRVNGTILSGGGGAGTVSSVTSANSYITVTSGTTTPVITANVGTTSGTLASGNDSRITGALQTSNNLSDLASSATARTNLGLGNSGVTAGTYGANNAVPSITVDALGRITNATSNAYQYADTINYGILRVPSGSNLTVSSGDLSLTGANVISALGYTPVSSSSATQWTTSGTAIYYNTGNIGIGVSSPTAALHVKKNGAASTPGLRMDGTWYSGGTATTTKPAKKI